MIFDGFGIDPVHAKLFPRNGIADLQEWRPLNASLDKYFEHYEGYISSRDYGRADDRELSVLAQKITSVGLLCHTLHRGICSLLARSPKVHGLALSVTTCLYSVVAKTFQLSGDEARLTPCADSFLRPTSEMVGC
jgi:hypothetical protein